MFLNMFSFSPFIWKRLLNSVTSCPPQSAGLDEYFVPGSVMMNSLPFFLEKNSVTTFDNF